MTGLEGVTEPIINKEREPRKTIIAGIVKGVREDLISSNLTTEGAEVIVGWTDIHCYFPRGSSPDKIVYSQFSSAEPQRLGMVEIKRIREMDRESLLEARKLASAGTERVAGAIEITGGVELLLSQQAITSFLEQVLDPQVMLRKTG